VAYVEAASNVIPFASPPRSVFIRTPSSSLYLTIATPMEKMTGPFSTGLRDLPDWLSNWQAFLQLKELLLTKLTSFYLLLLKVRKLD
jgi:hypothetical protein